LPTFVLAQSLGGAVAAVALSECPYEGLRGIIFDSTFASYRDISRRKLGSMFLTWPLQYPLSWLVSDWRRPDEAIKLLQLPSLFFHSRKDPVVPYDEGRALYAAAQEPKTWVDVEGEGHTLALASRDSPYRQTLIRFFDLWADGRPPPKRP
jgi:hypothetical protein